MHFKNNLSFARSALIYLISFSIALCFPCTSYALQDDTGKKQPKIAVLDFKGKNINTVDTEIITSQFRTALFNTGRYMLLDGALVMKILEKFDYAADTCDVGCAVNIGESLDTDKVITVEVSRLGKLYQINIQMVDIDSVSLEVTESFHEKCALEDLSLLMPEIVDKFLKKVDEVTALKIASIDKKTERIPGEPEEAIPEEIEKVTTEPVEVVKNGNVIVKTIPEGAAVTANGKFFGVSPFDPVELAPGKYSFIAKKKGYTDAAMEIEILPEKTTELLLSLKPIQVVASPEAEKPEEEKSGGTSSYNNIQQIPIKVTPVPKFIPKPINLSSYNNIQQIPIKVTLVPKFIPKPSILYPTSVPFSLNKSKPEEQIPPKPVKNDTTSEEEVKATEEVKVTPENIEMIKRKISQVLPNIKVDITTERKEGESSNLTFVISAHLLEKYSAEDNDPYVKGDYSTHEKLRRVIEVRIARIIREIAPFISKATNVEKIKIRARHGVRETTRYIGEFNYSTTKDVPLDIYVAVIENKKIRESISKIKRASIKEIVVLWSVEEDIINRIQIQTQIRSY